MCRNKRSYKRKTNSKNGHEILQDNKEALKDNYMNSRDVNITKKPKITELKKENKKKSSNRIKSSIRKSDTKVLNTKRVELHHAHGIVIGALERLLSTTYEEYLQIGNSYKEIDYELRAIQVCIVELEDKLQKERDLINMEDASEETSSICSNHNNLGIKEAMSLYKKI